MLITVCELPEEPLAFEYAWDNLVKHVHKTASDICLLPEMIFAPWFAANPTFDQKVWSQALSSHSSWLTRLPELAPAIVLGTRPIEVAGQRYNEAFIWDILSGYKSAHLKYYLPNESGYWEAHWYSRGDGAFEPTHTRAGIIGFTICTEMWALEEAQRYGMSGSQILASPRATGPLSAEKWLAGGRAAAVTAGAFCISSNRRGKVNNVDQFDGGGWIVDPDSNILGVTTESQPFLTESVDLEQAIIAKSTYPRYAIHSIGSKRL